MKRHVERAAKVAILTSVSVAVLALSLVLFVHIPWLMPGGQVGHCVDEQGQLGYRLGEVVQRFPGITMVRGSGPTIVPTGAWFAWERPYGDVDAECRALYGASYHYDPSYSPSSYYYLERARVEQEAR